MSESTLTSPSTISPLQAMLHELYSLLEQVTIAAAGSYSGYTGANPKLDLTKITALANGLGYLAGSGGAITQATSKSTGVTLNKATGQITLNSASLASGAIVAFLLTNSTITVNDVVIVNMNASVGNPVNYRVWAGPQAGGTSIYVENRSGGSLAEAIVLNFAVIKAANS